ncbi:MAG: AAA family ATPase [Acidiferrobacterales bacterium]
MGKSLIDALQNPALYAHPVGEFRVVETHISWILLTGLYAYKIKKPVNLGFVDFSTLEKRRHYCQEELRLNRRLAPELYVGVVGIGGTPQWPTLEVRSGAMEYAVKMVQFDDSQRLDHLLESRQLTSGHIDQLADRLAAFHNDIEMAPEGSDFGTPEAVYEPIEENFTQIGPLATNQNDRELLQQLRQWSGTAFEQLQDTIAARKHGGYVRECHGDAHLANMVLIEDEVVLFDCLEFNARLRWIDVISEIAFCVMDLDDRERADLAARLLDRYLQRSGDYAGLALLRFYQVYRAMVRAKVAAIRASQLDGAARNEAVKQYRLYTGLAQRYSQSSKTLLVITYGLSGSGKSTIAQEMLQQLPFIRLRSDVERKRLFGLALDDSSDATRADEIYGRDANRDTFDRLEQLARVVLAAGFAVIVDATFLRQEERNRFRRCAEEFSVPYRILSVEVSEPVARDRIRKRQQAGDDASEASLEVLTRQLQLREPLTSAEQEFVLRVNNGGALDPGDILATLKAFFN